MAEDLSIHHELLGDLFSLPSTGEEWPQFELSAEQLAFFEEYGYLRGIRVLDDRQVEILQSELAVTLSAIRSRFLNQYSRCDPVSVT